MDTSDQISQLTTIDLDSLTAVTGGKILGDTGGPPPAKSPAKGKGKGKGKGLSVGQRILIGGAGLIGLLGGPDDVMPRPTEIPNFRPPITISQPKFTI